MVITREKTKFMLVDRAKKYYSIPELYLSEEDRLEIVENMKLVGYQISSDISTKAHTRSL